MTALLHNNSGGRRSLRITRYYDNCSTLAVTKTKERIEAVGNILISGPLITELLIISPRMHKSSALMKGVTSRKAVWRGSAEGVNNNNKSRWQGYLYFFPSAPPSAVFTRHDCEENVFFSKATLLLRLPCRLVCCWDIMFVRRSLRNLEIIATLLLHPPPPCLCTSPKFCSVWHIYTIELPLYAATLWTPSPKQAHI